MNKELLQNLLHDISKVRIAIVGDFCLDVYWFIDESMSEISIETGEPTYPVSEQRYTLGGAGNVANNLVAMGVRNVSVFGIIGSDPYGAEMVKIMQKHGIDTASLHVQESLWDTHTYTKPYIEEKELSRIDFGNFNQLSESSADLLISDLNDKIKYIDLIIINQQVPSGIHTEYFRRRLLDLIKNYPGKIFIVDSRNFNEYYDCVIHKMNDHEALRICGMNWKQEDTIPLHNVIESAKLLFERFRKPLFITRGNRGSLTIDESGISEMPSIMITSRIDTVGAGDSYLAGAASALAAGYEVRKAAEFGTLIAGVTVQKLFQTGTASPQEILNIGTDPDYIYSPDIAEDIRQAQYLTGTEIEIINRRTFSQKIKFAIFDHDGTISTLREGWEKVMAPMMIKEILGEEYYDVDENSLQKIKLRVLEYIDTTTGIQTISQMKGLCNLILEFGYVPEEKILDPFEYKSIYNRELLRLVSERENKLKKNELYHEDFMIKNSLDLIRRLHDSGIILYLASGTDIEDVRREAGILGYDSIFGDRIYGSEGKLNVEAKRLVLDRILDNIGGTESGSIITFGDGPVEIRETRKRGGITVGIASDEIRRYGLNEKKRTRLIKAGADIIIPDFSQYELLLNLLKIS